MATISGHTVTYTAGFPEVQTPLSEDNQGVRKIRKVVIPIFKGLLTWTCVGLIGAVVTAYLSPLFLIPVGVAAYMRGHLSLPKVVTLYRNREIDVSSGFSGHGKTRMMPCQDSRESYFWKKRLIQNAEKNIVLSGNYCGGTTFDVILDSIKIRMEQKPELQAVVMTSPKFFTANNKKRLRELEEAFPHRFCLVITDDVYHISPGIKKTTNHTKGLSVDDGSYFILGGSGVEDKYVKTRGLGKEEDPQGAPSADDIADPGFIIRHVIARNFRDMDFVFKSEPIAEPSEIQLTAGQGVHQELLKLAHLWQSMNASLGKRIRPGTHAIVENLLAAPMKHREFTLPEFRPANEGAGETEIYATGPENTRNAFRARIVEAINNANERLIIDHMFFHPTQDVFDSIVAAARRGVKVTIITNGNERFSPAAHKAFGPRNRYNYWCLLRALSEEERENVEIYEFGNEAEGTPRKTTLHKKVIIADDTVIAGSSNMGYKSYETMSDHELNFTTTSKAVADKTESCLRQDIGSDLPPETPLESMPARRVRYQEASKKMTLDVLMQTLWHRITAPLIG